MNLSEAIGEYMQHRRARRAQQTWRMDEVTLNKLLGQTGDIPVTDLTPAHLEAFFYDPDFGLSGRVQDSTFGINRSRLMTFSRWLLREGHVSIDLMLKVEPRSSVKKSRKRLTPEQMSAAIDSCQHPRDRILVALACNTGLRISSILALRLRHVDLDSGMLIAPVSKTKQELVLPITADLDGELRLWFEHYRFEMGDLDLDWYLVPARPQRYNGWDGPRTIVPAKPMRVPWPVIHEALASIGVDAKGEGFHTMRRSAGRSLYEMLVAAGDPRAIHIVQAFYGHAEARMTQHYIGTDEERRRLHEVMVGKRFLSNPPTDVILLDERRRA